MQRVLVLSSSKQPLMPCQPARARQLLRDKAAAVFRRYPFTIILKDRETGETQPVAVQIDPGSRTTGFALVANFKRGHQAVWGAEVSHRGVAIRKLLDSRRSLRRSRRNRKTRYRPARFMNRRRPDGWLPPSLESRIRNMQTWVERLSRFAPITSAALELVKFDTHALQNPEIDGVEYQQGELFGYEVREYLLEKWGRTCAYCGKKDVSLEVEHINPKSRGGSNRVSNLTLACTSCNQKKGNKTAAEFGFPDLQKQARRPLKDAAAVNSSRWAFYRRFASDFPVECGTGGRTKYNRVRQGYDKAHWIDAACVAKGEVIVPPGLRPLLIKATGRGSHQRCTTDKYGFTISHKPRKKIQFGFQTGDIVRAVLPKGKYAGVHVGRLAVRTSGSFTIDNRIPANHKYCRAIHRADGYSYTFASANKGEACQSRG